MKRLSNLVLLSSFSVLTIVNSSCQKDDLKDGNESTQQTTSASVITDSTTANAISGTAGLLYENTFESTSNFPTNPLAIINKFYNESSRVGAIALSSDVKRNGSGAVRFEVTKADAAKYATAGSNAYLYERAELTGFSDTLYNEKWYGFSQFLPNDFVTDPNWDLFFQMKQRPDASTESRRNPSLSMLIKNGRYYFAVRYSAEPINTTAPLKLFDLGPVTKNAWVDWVFHFKLSYGSDGLTEVYKNKQKVLSYVGPNAYNDKRMPFYSYGIYKFDWETAEGRSLSPTDKRVFYFDAFRAGDKNSSLEEVSPR